MISYGKFHLGLAKTGLNSEVVLILGGLNREILLYCHFKRLYEVISKSIHKRKQCADNIFLKIVITIWT